jgi:hypothetical protein
MVSNRHDPLDNDGGGWLYLLGRVALRLFQAALVTGAVAAFFYFFGPRGGDTKEKAYIAAMKSDLRNLVTAQESFFADHHTFAPSLETLGPSSYQTSVGVTVVIDSGAADGWVATATHAKTRYRCGIYVASEPITPTPVLSWTGNPPERHALLRAGDSTWIERWPGHEELFHLAGRDTAFGSAGTLLRRRFYPSLELFVRDRGQPLQNILWRQGGLWHVLGPIVPGSEPEPVAVPEPAPPRITAPWSGAREGVPICWKG